MQQNITNYKQHHINQTLKNPKIKKQVLLYLIRLDLQKKKDLDIIVHNF